MAELDLARKLPDTAATMLLNRPRLGQGAVASMHTTVRGWEWRAQQRHWSKPFRHQCHIRKTKTLAVKYGNPANSKETGAGRANRPRWFVSALKGGKKKLTDFAVD